MRYNLLRQEQARLAREQERAEDFRNELNEERARQEEERARLEAFEQALVRRQTEYRIEREEARRAIQDSRREREEREKEREREEKREKEAEELRRLREIREAALAASPSQNIRTSAVDILAGCIPSPLGAPQRNTSPESNVRDL